MKLVSAYYKYNMKSPIEINDRTKLSFTTKEIISFVSLLAFIIGSWFNITSQLNLQKQSQVNNDKLILQKLASIDEKLGTHIAEGNRLEERMNQKVTANDVKNNEQDSQIAALSARLSVIK